jgi:hypothetical protein
VHPARGLQEIREFSVCDGQTINLKRRQYDFMRRAFIERTVIASHDEATGGYGHH